MDLFTFCAAFFIGLIVFLWLGTCRVLIQQHNEQKASAQKWTLLNDMLRRENPEMWEVAKQAGAQRLAEPPPAMFHVKRPRFTRPR